MSQYSEKLLEYLQSEHERIGKCEFTSHEVFTDSGIDFGDQKMIERAFKILESNGTVSQGKYCVLGYTYHLN